MPYTFEDRTGDIKDSDFDDIYDRMFLRVASYPHASPGRATTLALYVMARRSTRHRDVRHLERQPSVILEFGEAHLGLGTIHFTQSPSSTVSIPMNNYLKKTTLFGGSLSRKFRASDGREYRWQYQSVDGHEWTCLSEEGYIVAHYDLRPPNIAVYGVSGNTFTVHDAYSSLCVDILASLTIMRYIAKYRQ
ncbi:hypothetical protein SCLCIDRAFT_138116 [Scleroderma citrinum Foug A]|uniref:DUF6593 domain-containing protein n=1 Tax=Scleroderma citrinum Foug A TaxID=1036808 RepID=A0A0C2YW41_9AGAM|nr:hypothetical protein SCLCIDRAFT_138116 [Scleroderma citrinum Foug A]